MTKFKTITDSISYEKGNVIGKGAYGIVYRGYYNNKEAAIKKIDLDSLDEKDMEVERHCELYHENVLKILTVEQDEFFKYIVLELCAGSLEQVIHNKYNGPTLPPDIMVFNQIANGLDYIHSKRLIHRDVKPANILISIENPTIMKWADFGLSKNLTTQHSSSMSGLKGTKSWMAPEILCNTKRISFKSDIFSTGLVFVVFLTHGIHPFGNHYFEQQGNIITNNPVNLHRLDREHFAAGIISEMIKDNPAERPSSAELKQYLETMIQHNKKNSNSPNNILNISSYLSIQFEDLTINYDVNLSHILGESNAATVFLGHINRFPVAVKRVLQTEQHSIRTSKDDQAINSLKHENIVKILRMYVKDNFRYTVMELCAGTLEEAIKNSYKGPNLPSDRQVLHEIVDGLDCIHSQHFVHANLKPTNILISMAGQVKLSDWDLNPLQTKVQKYLEGILIWQAPEILKAINESQDNFTPISDVFSIGCICFYFVTRGIHPFGDVKEVQNNIQTNNPVNINKLKSDNFPVPVINKLIEHDQLNRMQLAEFKEWLINSYSKTSESITTGVNHKENSVRNAVIENKLGRGRYGTVSKGTYTDANGKTVVAAFKSAPTGEDTFLTSEIEILKQLNHLFVIGYLDVIEKNSRKWIVMELCEGSLKAYVKGELERVPKNTLDDRILIAQITLGLAYIHHKKIIHKDLKPENILLWCQPTKQGLVLAKIADFGFSQQLKPVQQEFSLTAHPGTQSYMAPELLNAVNDNYPASFASDVYSLGITIGWIALKGTHPIISSGKEMMNLLVMKGMIPQNIQTLSWDLQHLLIKLTDKDPKKRPNINLVLLHPYFVLTNDKTKWQFINTLFDLLEVKKQSKAVHEILNSQNFHNWYNTLSAYGTQTDEDASNKRDLQILSKMLSSEILYDIESYEHVIIETVKVEYDINVGSQLDRILYNQTSSDDASLPYRLYKLIQSAPKLVSLYIWTQLVKIFADEVQQDTNVEDSSKMETQSTIRASSCPSIKINRLMKPEKLGNQLTTPVSDLVWSSLFYDKRELVDELWIIKNGSEQFKKDQEMDQETLNGMLVSLFQCDFTEKIWRILLTKMEDVSSLLFASVQSHFSTAAKMTKMILKEKGWPSWMMENKEMLLTPMHIAAYNQGEFGAEIMKILLDNGGDPNVIGPHCVTPLHYAAGNESDSALGIVKLLLRYEANPNVCDHQGSMPIHYAACNEGDDAHEIIKELLVHGADPNAIDINGKTAFHYAEGNQAQHAHFTLKLLLSNKR